MQRRACAISHIQTLHVRPQISIARESLPGKLLVRRGVFTWYASGLEGSIYLYASGLEGSIYLVCFWFEVALRHLWEVRDSVFHGRLLT